MADDDAELDRLSHAMSRPIDPTTWTSGRVVRLLHATPRVVRERFWLDLAAEHQPWSWTLDQELQAHPGWTVIGEQRFEAHPPLGPITLWVRDLPRGLSDDEYAEQVAGNLAPVEDPIVPPPLEIVDASDVDPLPESDVWSWFGRLDGKPTYGAIDKVAVQLALEDEATILGMAQGGMRLMESLDRPDLDAIWTDEEGRRCAPPLLDRGRRGAILAGGEDVYRAALRDGASAAHHPPSDGSWSVPHLGGTAWAKHLRRFVLVTTRWSPEDGSNAEAWQGIVAATPPYQPPPEVVQRGEAAELAQRAVWSAATGEHPNDHPRGWFTIRFIVIDPAGAREVVQYVSDESGDPLRTAESTADDAAAATHGRRVGAVEVFNPHTARPQGGSAFVIKRRFSRGVEAYRERYGL